MYKHNFGAKVRNICLTQTKNLNKRDSEIDKQSFIYRLSRNQTQCRQTRILRPLICARDGYGTPRANRHESTYPPPKKIMKRALALLCQEQWSPMQIAGARARVGVHISHERIYRVIRADKSDTLAWHTRHRMKHHRRTCRGKAGVKNIPDRIYKRPSCGNRRNKIRRLGNGPDCRSATQRYCDTDRAQHKLHFNASAARRKESSAVSKGCYQYAVCLEAGCENHNY